MIDTFLKSKDKTALDALSGSVTNLIPAVQGRAESKDEDGNAVPAKGDPEYWYTCVRAPFPVPAYGDIEACSVQDGVLVCGVWS